MINGDPTTPIVIPLTDVYASQKGELSWQDKKLLLTCDPHQYHFSAAAQFQLAGISERSRRIEVALTVLSGRIAVGWYVRDAHEFAVKESAGRGKHIVDLIVPAGTRGGQLIFQNEAASASRVLIEAIAILPNRPAA